MDDWLEGLKVGGQALAALAAVIAAIRAWIAASRTKKVQQDTAAIRATLDLRLRQTQTVHVNVGQSAGQGIQGKNVSVSEQEPDASQAPEAGP